MHRPYMNDVENWKPSKYVMRRGKLTPTTVRAELAPSSRFIAHLVASRYQKAIAEHANGKLLDLGCGKVPLYEIYRDRVSENVCTDWPSTIHKNSYIDTFCDLSKALPFGDNTFDTILSSDVIEHLPDHDLAFREMGRVLAPGGTLILNTPFMYMVHEIPHDFYRHTRFSIERLTALAGLQVMELDEIGGGLDVLVDILAKYASGIPVIGDFFAIGLQKVATLLSGTTVWERQRKASASRFPLGHFLVARKPDASNMAQQ